jgi:hypothetical protein
MIRDQSSLPIKLIQHGRFAPARHKNFLATALQSTAFGLGPQHGEDSIVQAQHFAETGKRLKRAQ